MHTINIMGIFTFLRGTEHIIFGRSWLLNSCLYFLLLLTTTRGFCGEFFLSLTRAKVFGALLPNLTNSMDILMSNMVGKGIEE